jgi:hypothetical protein
MVDCLPYETRLAMLEGLARYEIIAGAYSTRGGGVCPMLAAHRCGGRTDFRAFARAWDRFTGARKRARKASERELRTLVSQLEASIWNERQVLELRSEADRLARRSNSADRPAEAPGRRGAAWLLSFRSYDEYRVALEAALRELDQGRRLLETDDVPAQGPPEAARSAGRTIITSGMTQTGESRSRQRTTSATS